MLSTILLVILTILNLFALIRLVKFKRGLPNRVKALEEKAASNTFDMSKTLEEVKLLRSINFWSPILLGIFSICVSIGYISTMTVSVPSGHVGIVKTFGKYTKTIDPGLHVKAPYEEVLEARISTQKKTLHFDSSEAGSAISIESQPVYAVVTMNYNLDPKYALRMYSKVGVNYYPTLIKPTIIQSFKEITVRYRTIDIAPNREKIRSEMIKSITNKLEKHGILVTNITLSNLDFDPDFVAAIEEKQVATEKAKAAKERVSIARADAESARVSAKGEADSIAIKGRALRENPDSLKLASIEKLNPNVEVIYLPVDSNIIINK